MLTLIVASVAMVMLVLFMVGFAKDIGWAVMINMPIYWVGYIPATILIPKKWKRGPEPYIYHVFVRVLLGWVIICTIANTVEFLWIHFSVVVQ